MRLKSIKYIEFEGQPNEWGFDCTWGDINLVVGRNAAGKTRLLNVTDLLAQLLLGLPPHYVSANFVETIFEDENQSLKYELDIEQHQVVYERLIEGDEPLLQRESNGIGQIWGSELNQKIRFEPPRDVLAVVVRRDKIQHKFLEKFYNWAKTTHYFKFGTSMGQEQLAIVNPKTLDLEMNLLSVTALFHVAERTFAEEFISRIKSDMQKINYFIEHIFIQQVSVVVTQEGWQKPYALFIQEKNLRTPIIQTEISSGMFRALSLLIQVNYLLLAGQPSCIIIDDIGEGLDFSRSTQLIKLLIEKVQGSQIQLIMSTNDQFVMDAVPLEYWQIIQREGNQLKIYNYHNSKAIFDDFDFTGLSNFDFFSSNYFLMDEPIA